ncbi:MAG: hypothetical protein JO251_05205 [Verrucomicrobia bacterium]|nr:hypothetical protein [Verrucomicrobiota bacterium]
MRTTVDLPDPLFKRVKAEAALRGMKLRDFIARSLEQALSGGLPEAESRQVKLPLVKGDGKRKIDPTREELDASLWEPCLLNYGCQRWTTVSSNSAD